MKRYKVGREIFHEFDDAVEYMKLEGYSIEDIEELNDKQESITKTESIVPDESSAMTPVEFVRQTTKDKGAEPKRCNSQPKKYDETLTTNNYIKEYYLRGYESLIDKSISSCPYCQKGWNYIKQELSNANENLSFETQNKEFESPELKIRETHLFYHHIPIAKLLHSLGIIQQFKMVDSTPSEGAHLAPTNPKNIHNLSREQLAQRIQENPELRKKFFRGWIKSLQT